MVNPYKPPTTATDASPVTQDRLMKRRMLYAPRWVIWSAVLAMVIVFVPPVLSGPASPLLVPVLIAILFVVVATEVRYRQRSSNQRRITRQQAGQENPRRFDEEI